MLNPKIQDFIDECQSAYACYTFCVSGMDKQAKQFESHLENYPAATIHIDNVDPRLKRSAATLGLSDLTAKLKRDSEYSSTVGKFLLVFIYSRWDEYHRSIIASSLQKQTKDVRCNLMGDLREIRNCIIHDKSIISQKQIDKLKCIHWVLAPGELNVTAEMMKMFVEQAHFMQKYIMESST